MFWFMQRSLHRPYILLCDGRGARRSKSHDGSINSTRSETHNKHKRYVHTDHLYITRIEIHRGSNPSRTQHKTMALRQAYLGVQLHHRLSELLRERAASQQAQYIHRALPPSLPQRQLRRARPLDLDHSPTPNRAIGGRHGHLELFLAGTSRLLFRSRARWNARPAGPRRDGVRSRSRGG